MKITPQSPACPQGQPLNALIIIIKGTQCVRVSVFMDVFVCVCLRVCLYVTNPLTPHHHHTHSSQPLKGPLSPSVPTGTIEPE